MDTGISFFQFSRKNLPQFGQEKRCSASLFARYTISPTRPQITANIITYNKTNPTVGINTSCCYSVLIAVNDYLLVGGVDNKSGLCARGLFYVLYQGIVHRYLTASRGGAVPRGPVHRGRGCGDDGALSGLCDAGLSSDPRPDAGVFRKGETHLRKGTAPRASAGGGD